ncbi:MAG: hypothetical protein WA823_14800 [Candidatus Acidiferrales bacterium]
MPRITSTPWRAHYWRTVGKLSGCDVQLSKSLSRTELAIFNRLRELEQSLNLDPDHASERQELTKAVEGLLLIKTVVLGWPDFHRDNSQTA